VNSPPNATSAGRNRFGSLFAWALWRGRGAAPTPGRLPPAGVRARLDTQPAIRPHAARPTGLFSGPWALHSCPMMSLGLWWAWGQCPITKRRSDSRCSPWSLPMGSCWGRTERKYARQRRKKAPVALCMTPVNFVTCRDTRAGAGLAPGAWDPHGGARCATAVEPVHGACQISNTFHSFRPQ
jgi:hypothetical protein